MPKERGGILFIQNILSSVQVLGVHIGTQSQVTVRPFLQVTPRCISGAAEARGEGGAPIESMDATAFILLF